VPSWLDGTTDHLRSHGDRFRDALRLQGTCPKPKPRYRRAGPVTGRSPRPCSRCALIQPAPRSRRRIISTARSAMTIVGALVFPLAMVGMMEPSMRRSMQCCT